MPVIATKISYVKGSRFKPDNPSGMRIEIELPSAKARGDVVEVEFAYMARYEKETASLWMRGTVYTREESPSKAAFIEKCFKEKRIPEDFFKSVLNAVNYLCSSEAALVAAPLNLNPPLIPMGIYEKGKQKKAG